MNYKTQYDILINSAILQNRLKLDRNSPNFVYYEKHHIIPTCLGGSNTKENLVLLTPEEHFDAHLLLALIRPKNQGLLTAAIAMSGGKIITRKEFGRLKRKFAKRMSKSKKGKPTWSKGKIFSEEERIRRFRIPHPGARGPRPHFRRPKEKSTCPHCGKIGGVNQMPRWHFDNCKLLEFNKDNKLSM